MSAHVMDMLSPSAAVWYDLSHIVLLTALRTHHAASALGILTSVAGGSGLGAPVAPAQSCPGNSCWTAEATA